jgi:hypothetical protein
MGIKVPDGARSIVTGHWVLAINMAALFTIASLAQGQSTWIRTYGGYGSDQGRAVSATPDGGYIIAGSTGSFGVGGDMYILKLDIDGEPEWSRNIGSGTVEKAYDVVVVNDGYYLVGTASSSDGRGYEGVLVNLDFSGLTRWRRTYGTDDWDFIHSIAVTDDHLFLAGKTYGGIHGGADGWVMCTDLEGDIEWDLSIGGVDDDEFNEVLSTPDGGFVAVGSKSVQGDSTDVWLVKGLANGTIEWERSTGTDGNDSGESVIRGSNGQFIVVGSSNGYSAFQEFYILSFAVDGGILWSNHIGQISDWEGYDIRERSDGGLIMVGYTTSFGLGGKDVYVLRTDASGIFEFGSTYGGSGDEVAFELDSTLDGGFVIVGSTTTFGPGPEAVYVIRTDGQGQTESTDVSSFFDPISVDELEDREPISVHPNPIREGGAFSLQGLGVGSHTYLIKDSAGRELVRSSPIDMFDNTVLARFEPGIYIMMLSEPKGRSRMLKFLVI